MPALKVNIIIVHPRGVVFPRVSKFYKNLVKWALTEIESSIAGTTTLDREWYLNRKKSVKNRKTVKTVMTLTWYRHF